MYTRLDFSSLEAYKESINAFAMALTGNPVDNDMTYEELRAGWKEMRRELTS